MLCSILKNIAFLHRLSFIKTFIVFYQITAGGLSEKLQEKSVQIISEDDCQKAVEELNGEIYNGHICFLHNTGGSCSVS